MLQLVLEISARPNRAFGGSAEPNRTRPKTEPNRTEASAEPLRKKVRPKQGIFGKNTTILGHIS